MARRARDSRIETREARLRLSRQREPYWRSIKPGLFVGYYRGKFGGTWIARCSVKGIYRKRNIGDADDHVEADGVDVFDYGQAVTASIAFASDVAKEERGITEGATVEDACDSYLKWFKLHRKSHSQTEIAINAYIRPLYRQRLNDLTTPQLRRWFEKLATQPKRLRSGKKKNEIAISENDIDAMRKRKASANRILSVLKAILNHAWREGMASSNEAWSRVRSFTNVDAPRIHYLTVQQCGQLIGATAEEFRPVVKAGLLTGCRWGELVSLKVRDFSSQSNSLHIAESKTGKPRCVPLNDEGSRLFFTHTRGRGSDEIIFLRPDGRRWGKSHQNRPMHDAVRRAQLPRETTFYTLRHTFASLLAQQGVSMRVLAEVLGNSAQICEKHYAHVGRDHVAEVVRTHLPSFAILRNVVPLPRRKLDESASDAQVLTKWETG